MSLVLDLLIVVSHELSMEVGLFAATYLNLGYLVLNQDDTKPRKY